MLFISDLFSLRDDTMIISDPRIHHQCLHVLRMKPWETFFLQPADWSVRYKMQITNIDKKTFTTQIVEKEKSNIQNQKSIISLISLPNRRDKAELIVQKLTEISVSQIIFAPSDRSIIRTTNEKKLERLHTIALEACEQSYGRHLPEISIASSLTDYCDSHPDHHYLLCDIPKEESFLPLVTEGNPLGDKGGIEGDLLATKKESKIKHSTSIILIGPEWWRSDRERDFFNTKKYTTLWLGSTVLRMETAAIVASRYVINHSKE